MKRYIAKRVAHALLVIYFVATIVFLVVRAIPGSPITLMLGSNAPPEARQALRRELGLNQPIYIQYFKWMSDMFTGNLGNSIIEQRSVLEMLIGVAEPTVSIGLLGMGIALTIALPAGIVSAVYRYQIEDHIATLVAFLGISMPGFWVGILLILLVGTNTSLVASFGYTSFQEGIVPWLQHIILPAIAVALPPGAILMRMTRSAMLEVINEDYMRTARAKGLDGKLILFNHGLQNALIPVVTVAGILFAVLLGGIVAVEVVFGINGLGRLLISSIERRDYPVIQGAVIVLSFIFVFMNLFIDILYPMINPQIRYQGAR
jgi:peptide/nickel transport system permease protein